MAGPGEADFKSNVLMRDEKGLFGIPFKRVIIAFMSSVLIYTVGKFALGGLAIPCGLATGILTVVITSPRGGIPYWKRFLYRLRAKVILTMIDAPHSYVASLGKFLELRTDSMALNSDEIFRPAGDEDAIEIDWSEWVTFSEASEAKTGEGLVIVEGPEPHLELAAGRGQA